MLPEAPSTPAARPSGGACARLVARRVLRRRCPRCGGGPLFRSFARLRESCPACGLVYRREPGAQTGSMYLTAAVNQLFAALAIALVVLFTDWGLALSLGVSVPLVLAFCIAFLPWSMAIWTGVEFFSDWVSREEWAELG